MSASKPRQMSSVKPEVLNPEEWLTNMRIEKNKIRFRPQSPHEVPCTIDSNQIIAIGEWALNVNTLVPIEQDFLLRCCTEYEHVIVKATKGLPGPYREALSGLEIAVIRERETVGKALDRTSNNRRVYLANIITTGTHARLEKARREMVRTIIKNTDDLAAIINLANDAYQDYNSRNGQVQASAIRLANAVQIILFHFIRSVTYEYARFSTDLAKNKDFNEKSKLNTISWLELEETVRGTRRGFTDSNEEMWTSISIQLRYIIVAGQLQKSLAAADLTALDALSRSPCPEGLAIFRAAYHTGLYDLLLIWKTDDQLIVEAEAEEQRYRESSARERPHGRPRREMNDIVYDDQYLRPNTVAPPQYNKDSRGRSRPSDFESSYNDGRSVMQDTKRRPQRPRSEGPPPRNEREHYRDDNNYDDPIYHRDVIRRRASSKFERPLEANPDDPYQAQLKSRSSRRLDKTEPSKEDKEKDEGKGKPTGFLNRLIEKYLP